MHNSKGLWNKENWEAIPKRSKVTYGIAAVFLLIFAVLMILSVCQPGQIEQVYYENAIRHKTSYEYKVDVMPSSLYPSGGVITPEGKVFTKITKGIRVNPSSLIIADKPVSVKGSYSIILKLAAEDYWEKDFAILKSNTPFELNGTDNAFLEAEVYIPVDDLLSFIEKLEEELGVAPSQYLLKVQPIVEGIITASDDAIPIDPIPEMTFSLNRRELVLMGEKEFEKEIPVKKMGVSAADFNALGVAVPLAAARITFSLISLFILIYLSIPIMNGIKHRRDGMPESAVIDRRYRKRLIHLKDKVDLTVEHILSVDDFDSLIRIADEKELPVLRYEDADSNKIYYVIDGQCVYSYKPCSIEDKKDEIGVNNVSSYA